MIIDIDNIGTYPNSIVKYINNLPVELKQLISSLNSPFSTDFIVYEKIDRIMLLENVSIQVIHVARLFEYEKEEIEKNGFGKTNDEFIQKKIFDAYTMGMISKEMKEHIENKYCINQNKDGLFYFYWSEQSLSEDDEVKNYSFFTDWGGEVINTALINKKEISESLLKEISEINSKSKPYKVLSVMHWSELRKSDMKYTNMMLVFKLVKKVCLEHSSDRTDCGGNISDYTDIFPSKCLCSEFE